MKFILEIPVKPEYRKGILFGFRYKSSRSDTRRVPSDLGEGKRDQKIKRQRFEINIGKHIVISLLINPKLSNLDS